MQNDLIPMVRMAEHMPTENGHPTDPHTLPASDAPSLDAAALQDALSAGDDVAIDLLKRALAQPESFSDDGRALLFKRALDVALETRDADLALMIARLMDSDPELDALIWGWLVQRIGIEPDAVYAFVRARLSADTGERWLPRLHAAASTSLQVATADGDWMTVLNWLKLIGREPAAYGLSETFTRGVRLAQPRAHTEPELATALILITVKRNQAALEALLHDAALLDALPDDNLRAALGDHEGDAVALLGVYGADVFLVVLALATRDQHAALITPSAVEQVWALRHTPDSTTSTLNTVHVSGEFAPDALIAVWIDQGAGWLATDTLAALLRLALMHREDHLFHRLIHPLRERGDLTALAGDALFRAGRGVNDVLALISQMVANSDISAQGAVDLFAGLLRAWDWSKTTVLMMAQLARAIQYHPELTVEPDVLWHMLEIAADAKEDLIARVAARRLTAVLESIDDDAAFVESAARLYHKTAWNPGARGWFIAWWRGFIRAQHGGRLVKLEKALESRKNLEELRAVAATVLALRRLIGKRTLEQFADAIGETYDMLQALSAAFDPDAKHSTPFDALTVRTELDARGDELTAHTRTILANNLKALATLIADMGDNRSKPGLVRRSDDLDRSLMSGDQAPGGAVDVLKWLSGYLSRAQDDDEANV
jgi:hypothetical protein